MKSLPANPLLAEPMYLSGLIEKMGSLTREGGRKEGRWVILDE